MLKQAAIIIAAITMTACGEDTAVSSTDTETTPATEKAKSSTLLEATKAAIVIESYEVEPNKVTPAPHPNNARGTEK